MALKKTRRWSKDIETRYHPPAGLFAAGSAKTIATTLLRDAPSEAVAMDRLNFYINRAGSNLTVARRRVLENAKRYLKLEHAKLLMRLDRALHRPEGHAFGSFGARRIDPITNVTVEVGKREVHTRIVAKDGVYWIERERSGPFAGFLTLGAIDDTGEIEQIGDADLDRKILRTLRTFLAERGAF